MERSKEIEGRNRFKEVRSWNIMKSQNSQTYNGICQGNRPTEITKYRILNRIAEMGEWATMEVLNNKAVKRKVYNSLP